MRVTCGSEGDSLHPIRPTPTARMSSGARKDRAETANKDVQPIMQKTATSCQRRQTAKRKCARKPRIEPISLSYRERLTQRNSCCKFAHAPLPKTYPFHVFSHLHSHACLPSLLPSIAIEARTDHKTWLLSRRLLRSTAISLNTTHSMQAKIAAPLSVPRSDNFFRDQTSNQ